MKIMISACLLGYNCKYNGGNNLNARAAALCKDNEIIPICPEVLGGLPTPRTPSEVNDEHVMTRDGRNVTSEYKAGAEKTLSIAEKEKPDLIVLQSRSPSCGVKERYDGTFTGKKIRRPGMTAGLLLKHGFQVTDIEDLT